MVVSANYCPMGPLSAVFSLDCYSWPYGNICKYCWSIIAIFCCLFTSLLWWCSSQSCMMGLQSKTGMMPWTFLLNINVARLSKPWPNDILRICSRDIFMSLPKLAHFLNVHFMNLIQASTCPLLWWWNTNVTACSMLIVLQNCQNLSATKLVHASNIIFGVYHIQWILF